MNRQKISILIIDDDDQICYTFKEICSFQNWHALTASNFHEACKLLDYHKPDAILVDYHLPVTDGIRIVEHLRKSHPHTPIIALTVAEQEIVRDNFIAAGADDFALKPIKALDLVSRIQMHLKYAQQRKYFGQSTKGINHDVVEQILQFLHGQDEYKSLDEISGHIKMSTKSVYRYMRYLSDQGLVERHLIYGKVGRPRNLFKLPGQDKTQK
jgi:two-component system response regulator DctR